MKAHINKEAKRLLSKHQHLHVYHEYTCTEIKHSYEGNQETINGRLRIYAEEFCEQEGIAHVNSFINEEVDKVYGCLSNRLPKAQYLRKQLRRKWLKFLINKTQ